MRLYGMCYLCKKYIGLVEGIEVEIKERGTSTVGVINRWEEKSAILNEIAKIPPLREKARKMYETIPTVFQINNEIEMSYLTREKFYNAKNELIIAMKTVIEVQESVSRRQDDKADGGFDIKLPEFRNIGEFSKCLGDLNFIINQCPYLRSDNCELKYGSMDVGSTWITFALIGTGASVILFNLSKLVDIAVKIKSHVVTVKAQEEVLRSIEMKNEIAEEVIKVFKQTNEVITNQYISELQQEIGELKDGEERDKTKRCLEKLALWMDKGMQIYSAIDAPKEVKDLFPTQAEVTYLSDDVIKLIEMKKDKYN